MVDQVWITWSVLTPGVGSTPLVRYLEMGFPKEDICHYEENREWTVFPKGNIYHCEKNREWILSRQKEQMSTTTSSSCISYHSLNTCCNFPFPALVRDVFFARNVCLTPLPIKSSKYILNYTSFMWPRP